VPTTSSVAARDLRSTVCARTCAVGRLDELAPEFSGFAPQPVKHIAEARQVTAVVTKDKRGICINRFISFNGRFSVKLGQSESFSQRGHGNALVGLGLGAAHAGGDQR